MIINRIGRNLKLLIVPYGIETPVKSQENGRFKDLLIVPYGIETYYFPRE